MKVSETLSQSSSVASVAGSAERKASEIKGESFQSQLKRVEGQNIEERINLLVQGIVEQGEKLSQRTDIRELKKYKKLISEFLDETVGNSRKFSKESFLDRRGRYKVFATVKKINEELDGLTKDVLSEEKDNIKILQRLDDIRGLILDITL